MYIHIFRVCAGWMAAAWTDSGLAALVLPTARANDAVNKIRLILSAGKKEGSSSGSFDSGWNAKLEKLACGYFLGQQVSFRGLPLDLSGGTPFQRRVWEVVFQIPYGQTFSYGKVAAIIGNPNASRAVGGALGANPTPLVIPCHRVVRGDGSLGGFTGGSEWKVKLLKLEGVITGPASGIRLNGARFTGR